MDRRQRGSMSLSQQITYYDAFSLLFDNYTSFSFVRNNQKKEFKKKKKMEKTKPEELRDTKNLEKKK